MAEAVGVEPTRADLESAVLTVRPRLENETTLDTILHHILDYKSLLFVSEFLLPFGLTIYYCSYTIPQIQIFVK